MKSDFDLSYLIDQAKHWARVAKFPLLGHIKNELTTMKDSTFESKVYGKQY